MTASDENFLSRWARRKADVAKAEARPSELPDGAAKTGEEGAEDPPFDLASLPSLDDITAQTDIRPFMHRLVPADLRNAALKRMWELDTAIRDYVGPATEYAWDWNEGGNAPGYGPLEAGYKAAEAAIRMFSVQEGDHTLVEGPAEGANSQAAAIASEIREQEPDRLPSKPVMVEMQTVRLSTKSDTIERVADSISEGEHTSEAHPGIEEERPIHAALHKSSARHGRATPK